MHRRRFTVAFAMVGLLTGCGDPTKADAPPKASTPSPVTSSVAEVRDAGSRTVTATDRNMDAGTPAWDGPFLGGLYFQTPIMSDMDWPTKDEERKKGDKERSVRIGYIRQGGKVPVIAEPHPKSNCKEGWYELVQGGFVCGRYASLDMNHPKIKLAPHTPDAVSSLPYQYGVNVSNGTPLYRSIPSREERLKLEPWLAPKKAKPKPRLEDDGDSTAAYGDDLDAGSPLQLARATQPADPFGLGADALDAGTPWYLRDYDGGKPQITLDELKGEGPVARRMVKGFFVALDKDFSAGSGRWWKTTSGLIAPAERLYVHRGASEFKGIWLTDLASSVDGGAPKAPIEGLCKPGSKAQVGIILWQRARKYVVGAGKKTVSNSEGIARHTVVRLTGETATIKGEAYDETDEGWWMKQSEGTKTKPGDAPKDLAPGEKWIDVNLTMQSLVAYEGDKAVFATAVSTGKKNDVDKEKDHRTPPGTFRIREKHIAATMHGDVASDGPYSIEDVPWIMYFNGSYALHGAFWHNNFGRNQSHGCVNLAPHDAKALFGWTEPRLPDGWHAIWSTPEKQGTRVVVHD